MHDLPELRGFEMRLMPKVRLGIPARNVLTSSSFYGFHAELVTAPKGKSALARHVSAGPVRGGRFFARAIRIRFRTGSLARRRYDRAPVVSRGTARRTQRVREQPGADHRRMV